MIGRSVVVRRRPLLRAAAVGATFSVGRAVRRHAQQRAAVGDAASQPARQAVPTQASAASAASSEATMMDQLSQLSMLHQQGDLTDDEFAAAKAKVLSS
ncbi:MAG TPA: SHOCT domain-containing protein [Streptosporangiaceae bacterium]|nr:SHOCT domain-containing protein [Streptosporangiaceae bacterium]